MCLVISECYVECICNSVLGCVNSMWYLSFVTTVDGAHQLNLMNEITHFNKKKSSRTDVYRWVPASRGTSSGETEQMQQNNKKEKMERVANAICDVSN